MSGNESCRSELAYDQLVLALGAVSNYLGLTNVQKLAFDFKSLVDAIRIRNHVIEMFERADRENDPAVRKSLLTFVIAGGGFAGVELAGSLNDFARGILADYPNLRREDVRVVLVHSRDRILPELSESLGRYAQSRMEARGVEFRLNTRLTDARPGVVVLSDARNSCRNAGVDGRNCAKSAEQVAAAGERQARRGDRGLRRWPCLAMTESGHWATALPWWTPSRAIPVRRPRSLRCAKPRCWQRTSAPA